MGYILYLLLHNNDRCDVSENIQGYPCHGTSFYSRLITKNIGIRIEASGKLIFIAGQPQTIGGEEKKCLTFFSILITLINGSYHQVLFCGRNSAVECQLPKLNVEGSIPFARSYKTPEDIRSFCFPFREGRVIAPVLPLVTPLEKSPLIAPTPGPGPFCPKARPA